MSLLPIPQPELPTIKPIVVQFPEFDRVDAATFSVDGNSIYALVPSESLNLRWIVREHGHWLSLAIIIPLVLTAIILLWRIRHHSRRIGLLYCRGCNYEVTALRDAGIKTCSECGRSLEARGTVAGERFMGRTIVSVVALVAAGTVAFLCVGLKRPTPTVSWIADRAGESRTLFKIARELNIGLPAEAIAACTLLVELDAATGVRVRTIGTLPLSATVIALPDSRELLVDGAEPFRVRIRDGKIIKAEYPGDKPAHFGFGFVLGYTNDGKSALMSRSTHSHTASFLVEWQLATGLYRPITSGEYGGASVGKRDARGNIISLIIHPVDGSEHKADSYLASAIDVESGVQTALNLEDGGFRGTIPVMSADGSRGYLLERNGQSAIVFDPLTGARIDTLDLSTGRNVTSQWFRRPYLINNDRWLAFEEPYKGLVSYDIESGQLIANLGFSPESNFLSPTHQSQSKSRLLSVAVTSRASTRSRIATELLIWDLSSIRSTPPATTTQPPR